MNRTTMLVATASAAVAFAAGLAISQPAAPDQSAMKKQIAAMMAAKGQPTADHKLLEPLIGERDMTISMNMGPGMPPLTAHAKARGEWVLGDRFVHLSTEPAEGEELQISSIGYIGFDTRTKKYFWWGIDSTDTYSVFAEGVYDDVTKSLVLLGENLEPEMGGKAKFRTIFNLDPASDARMSIAFAIPDEMRGQMPEGAIDAEGFMTIMSSTVNKD